MFLEACWPPFFQAALRELGAARTPKEVSKEVSEVQIDIPRAGHKYPLGLARQGRKITWKDPMDQLSRDLSWVIYVISSINDDLHDHLFGQNEKLEGEFLARLDFS